MKKLLLIPVLALAACGVEAQDTEVTAAYGNVTASTLVTAGEYLDKFKEDLVTTDLAPGHLLSQPHSS